MLDVYLAKKLRNLKKNNTERCAGRQGHTVPPPPQRRGQPSTVRFGFCFFEAMGSKLPGQAGFQGMAPHTARFPPASPRAPQSQVRAGKP